MFNYVMVGSSDIERSKRFYDDVLGTLGAREPLRDKAGSGHVRLFYRHDGSTPCVSEPIDGEAPTFANGSTIAFKCASPEQVRQFHDTAIAHSGASIEDAPGLRSGNIGAMHLAYVRDPDGHRLCAIHRSTEVRSPPSGTDRLTPGRGPAFAAPRRRLSTAWHHDAARPGPVPFAGSQPPSRPREEVHRRPTRGHRGRRGAASIDRGFHARRPGDDRSRICIVRCLSRPHVLVGSFGIAARKNRPGKPR